MTQETAAAELAVSEGQIRRLANEGLIEFRIRSSQEGQPRDYLGRHVRAIKKHGLKAWRIRMGIPAEKKRKRGGR